MHSSCYLQPELHCSATGRELLQYGWIAHPPAGDAFNSSAYQEAMTALATTILGQTQDPLAFANSMAVAVQHWYPQYFTLVRRSTSRWLPLWPGQRSLRHASDWLPSCLCSQLLLDRLARCTANELQAAHT